VRGVAHVVAAAIEYLFGLPACRWKIVAYVSFLATEEQRFTPGLQSLCDVRVETPKTQPVYAGLDGVTNSTYLRVSEAEQRATYHLHWLQGSHCQLSGFFCGDSCYQDSILGFLLP
jgi:hypothetical protein